MQFRSQKKFCIGDHPHQYQTAVACSPSKTYPPFQQFGFICFSELNHIRGIKSIHVRNLKSSVGFANFWRTCRRITDKEHQFYNLTAWTESGMEGEKITQKISGLAWQLNVLTHHLHMLLSILYCLHSCLFLLLHLMTSQHNITVPVLNANNGVAIKYSQNNNNC